MIRDPGPVHNIGHSVTSRDVPTTGEETDGISPNSGIISRAVNGNPITKFFASSAATMVGAFAASKLTKAGGLRLAKRIQDRSANETVGFATTVVKSVTELRRHLDELQGLTRKGGDRAYTDLVWEMDGKLTTGIDLDGRLQETSGLGFLKTSERAAANTGGINEPAVVWSFRDTLQQKMVRAGRRLPYELPAFYAAQRAIVDPLFGEKLNDQKEVNWFNPVDVVTDFVKQSVSAAATMILPFEFAGAAANQTRSSLHTIRHSTRNLNRLTPIEQKMHKGFFEVDELLKEVGHDLAGLQSRFLRTSAQASGAFSAVADPYRNRQGFVQNLHSLRHGYKSAKEKMAAQKSAGEAVDKITFKDLFNPERMKNFGGEATVQDLLPGLSGISTARKEFMSEFRRVGDAYDVLSGARSFDDIIKNRGGAGYRDQLTSAINKIASMSNSKVLKAADQLSGGTPGFFMTGRQQDEFKKILEQKLLDKNYSVEDARNFVSNLRINQLPRTGVDFDPTQIVSMGRVKNYGIPGSPNASSNESFFENMLLRYRSVSKNSEIAGSMSAKELESVIKNAAGQYANPGKMSALNQRIHKEWSSIAENHLGEIGSAIAGKRKLSYLSFRNENQQTLSSIRKAVAATIGVSSTNERSMINALAARGFDPNDFNSMRSFLIRNRKMSSNIFGSQSLGMKGVTIGDVTSRDYASLDNGLKRIISEQQHDGLVKMVSASNKGGNPLSASLDQVSLSGLYRRTGTSGADYLNYSGVKSSFRGMANFFMDEFKIPVLGFNPFNLFGKSSFNAMASSSPIQYMSGRSVQPFIGGMGADDFGIFIKTANAKGKILKGSYDTNARMNLEMLEGFYRPVASSSNELLSRYAREASGVSGDSPYDIRASMEGRSLTVGERIRKRFDVDIDQPNALAGFVQRFRGRAFDVENPTTLTKLLGGDEVVRYSGGKKQVLVGRYSNNRLDIVDKQTGQVVRSMSDQEVFKGMDVIRRASDQYGVASPIIREFESRVGFSTSGRKIPTPEDAKARIPGAGQKLPNLSDVRSPQDLIDYVYNLVAVEKDLLTSLSLADEQIQAVQRSQAKLMSLISRGDLSGLSSKSADSPTITTMADDVMTAIFKHRMSTERILGGTAPGSAGKFDKLSEVLDDLVSTGKVSSAQRAEAKASVFGSLIDSSAFSTYQTGASVSTNAKSAFLDLINNQSSFKGFSEPFADGSINNITGAVKRRLAPLTSQTRGRFNVGKHSLDDFSTDPLGSGQSTTFVPTFGTVFQRNPYGAMKSVAGITTYSDPSSYSNASAAVAHTVGRLNKYFGTVGMGISGDYRGPLSEFAIGMVGKRVLPAYIAGMTFVTADRTAGGLVNEKDAQGDRVYSPLLITTAARGAVEVQSALSGLVPGGAGYQEKREQLLEGEVAIRQGRYWPLGLTPFKGGKIEYYRPSYYRRLQAGAMYTDDTYGSPLEKFLFYTDVSPLRPLDPYRFERKHYDDRPYPVTGEYFTGPFGPLTSIGNMTIGKLLKPKKMMHEEELRAGLANYMPAGEFGAYDASAYIGSNVGYQQPSIPGPPLYGATGISGSAGMPGGFSQVAQTNADLASRAGPTGLATGMVRNDISSVNSQFAAMAYGPPKAPGVMTPNIVASGAPIGSTSLEYQLGEFGYRTQEMAGIYGFALGNLRETFGFGGSDFTPPRSVLQSAGQAYGTSRAFWDLNLGGLGDVPLPSKDAIGNIEFSEIVRRFIPKQRTDVDFINPIRNRMADQYPFLPGSEYFTNFKTGDPYTKVKEGELRLPGIGYERLNRLYSDASGDYGAITQLDILADVAPYSKQFRTLNRQMDSMALSPDERIRVSEIREQVESKSNRNEFSEYRFKGSSAEDMGIDSRAFALGRLGEAIAHSDNFIVNKVIGDKTAVEDWERKNVYGSTFPQWQNPISSFIAPMVNKATQDNPLVASVSLAAVGSFFGATPRARAFGATVGLITGGASSIYGQAAELISGDRYIPMQRKQELALEEYTDILSYVKSSRLATMAQQSGDFSAAVQYRRQAQSTMYGADLNNMNLEMMKFAIPKRKREHFEQMIQETDKGEQERILSTAGRLERRIYQAAWGMKVEKRPELDEYLERHELPDESWEGWHANTNMDHVKIKMGQSMGLDMSQMGYYPQQIDQANLSNPAYPSFFADEQSEDMFLRLKSLMNGSGVSGTVIPVANTFGRQDISISYGV